jgi:cobalt-zinc-cadmium efflux system outer membrane protein
MAIGLLYFINSAYSADCPSPKSAQDLLQCARENHPDILKLKLGQSQTERLEAASAQRPNPELQVQSGFINITDNEGLATQASLLHTWELGGKRNSRIQRARAELSETNASMRSLQEEISTRILLQLHRLRQVEEELLILNETAETFGKQVSLLKRRPSLTPDQDVSYSIFTLAKEDIELKAGGLEAEKKNLIQSLQIAIRSTADYSKSWLPSEDLKWPDLPATPKVSEIAGRAQQAQAALNIAKADLETARSESWPDLKLGPFIETESSARIRTSSVGLAFSAPLPFFHFNGGGREFAQTGLTRAEESSKITHSVLTQERELERTRYEILVSRLKNSRWHQEYERRHRRIESLFQRGVLSAPMIIEAHRQIIEVQKTSHDLELRALSALAQILILDGKLPEILP